MVQTDSTTERVRQNELTLRRLGCGINLNPWVANVSSSRLHMFAGHLGQMLVISNPTRPKNLTGIEREYGKYVWNHRTRSEIRIVRIIPRFGVAGYDRDSISHSPSKLIIYERADTREIGCMELTDSIQKHQYFGYFLQPQPILNTLRTGDVIPENTILAQSPNVTSSGDWRYGREADVIFMSLPQVIEDGFVACEEDLEMYKHWRFSSVVASAGGLWIPLNLYGDENNYKAFPDIGERIRDDGLVFALRRWNPEMAFVQLTPRALQKFDHAFDRGTYGKAGAVVTNVDIWCGGENRHWQDRLPVGVEKQFVKYEQRNKWYAKTIVDTYMELVKQNPGGLQITSEFNRVVYDALMRIKHNKRRINYTYKRAPVDDWRLNLTYAYERIPTIGDKFTGTDGDKGVLVDKWPAADMPRNEFGQRASFIMDGESTIKRMNPSRVYKQYVNSATWHLQKRVIELMQAQQRQEAWEYLSGYWELAYPEHWALIKEFIATFPNPESGIDVCLAAACEFDPANGEFLSQLLPPNSEVIGVEQIRRIANSKYRPIATPVTFRGRSGRMITTVNSFIIGTLTMLLLEKIADDSWSSVSSPKIQHLGIPAKQSRVDKLGNPGNNTPVRIIGEDEGRLIANNVAMPGVSGGTILAELLELTNNPQAHRFGMRRILTADNPGQIPDKLVDQNVVPMGGNRPVALSKHLINCMGAEFVRHKYEVK